MTLPTALTVDLLSMPGKAIPQQIHQCSWLTSIESGCANHCQVAGCWFILSDTCEPRLLGIRSSCICNHFFEHVIFCDCEVDISLFSGQTTHSKAWVARAPSSQLVARPGGHRNTRGMYVFPVSVYECTAYPRQVKYIQHQKTSEACAFLCSVMSVQVEPGKPEGSFLKPVGTVPAVIRQVVLSRIFRMGGLVIDA